MLMNAIAKAKIYSRPRQSLEKLIPLEAPFSVQIDICSLCNMKCNFCFHSDEKAIARNNVKFGMMDYTLFTKIIDDMKIGWGYKKIKKLRLFKIGEPLLNPNICRMIKYAKQAEIAECIEITTNGTLLDKELSLRLIEAGVDILNISINGINEEQYKNACQFNINFNNFREKIAFFYENKKNCKVYIKYSDIGYSKEEKDAFYKLFGDICDEIFIETISSTMWHDTIVSSTIKNAHKSIYGEELKYKNVCPFLFTTMVVNDKGIVHLCCIDWTSSYILGDLKKQSICDVWCDKKIFEYQKMHLINKRTNIPICRNCESLSGNTIDDIDDYADIILKRIENTRISQGK